MVIFLYGQPQCLITLFLILEVNVRIELICRLLTLFDPHFDLAVKVTADLFPNTDGNGAVLQIMDIYTIQNAQHNSARPQSCDVAN